jgi:hypothetical protein
VSFVIRVSASELQWISPVVSKAVAFMIEYGPSIFKVIILVTVTNKHVNAIQSCV